MPVKGPGIALGDRRGAHGVGKCRQHSACESRAVCLRWDVWQPAGDEEVLGLVGRV